MEIHDVIIIGAGQAGLSVAYFLRRTSLNYVLIDDQAQIGGAWLQAWDSLQLFSAWSHNSLAGWQMPKSNNDYPTKYEFIKYLKAYHERYNFPILRNTKVTNVTKKEALFKIETNQGILFSKALVSATGTAKNPFIPQYPNQEAFKGIQLHSIDYKEPQAFKNKKVLVVGGGNSGAQILSELSKVAFTKWVTDEEPRFLPEDIDGYDLFTQANLYFLNKEPSPANFNLSLSDIVQVDSVKDGKKRNVYNAVRPFSSFYGNGVIWTNGTEEAFDAVIWCTGFRPNLQHLKRLGIINAERIETSGTRSIKEPLLWLVGYGNWTGFASATIYGVGKTARDTAKEIDTHFH